jgi:hypothetical protein
MKTIELANREISVADFSDFETNLQLKSGSIMASIEEWTTPDGVKHFRLTDAVVTFDEMQSVESEIEGLCLTHGFQRRDAS